MLDQQFFNAPEFKDYLTSTFVMIHADRENELGRSLFEKFAIRSTPTVLLLNADGEEVDRVVGYGPPAAEYRTALEKACTGDQTLLALRTAHRENPGDLLTTARLARKYETQYRAGEMAPLVQALIDGGEASAAITLPYGEDNADVSALEYAAFMQLFEKPELIQNTLAEYPESVMTGTAYGRLERLMRREATRDEYFGVAEALLEDRPDDPALLAAFIRASARTGQQTERAVELADHLTSLESYEPDSHLNPEMARLYVKAGMEDKALAVYGEAYIAPHMDDSQMLNGYAWFWALEEKNLDHALAAITRAVELDPQDDNLLDTMSMVQWMMGDHEAAIATEEKALEMTGGQNTDYQERIQKIREDMNRTATGDNAQ